MCEYNFTYATICSVNRIAYLGKHSTDNLNDGYLGSGILLNKDIKLFGRDSFNRIILEFYDTENESYRAENKLITKDIVDDPCYYNLTTGGQGFSSEDAKIQWQDPKSKQRMSERMIEQWQDEEFRQMMSERMSEGSQNPESKQRKSERSKEMWQDPEYRQMMTERMTERITEQWQDEEYRQMKIERMTGENNPNTILTEKQVIDIKKRLLKGERGVDIAKIYGVSNSIISKINCGRTWKHITIEPQQPLQHPLNLFFE